MLRPRTAVLTLAASFGFASISMASGGGVEAVNKALAESKSSGKPLLLVAGAEWCGPCKMLEKLMKTDEKVKAVTSKFVYHHIDVDHDKEAWAMWTKKYNNPGNGIPTIYIVKPSGELAHSQCGVVLEPTKCAAFFAPYAKASAGVAAITPKTINLMKTAAKEAEALLDEGKFVSAYEKFAEYSEELKSDNKALTKVKATVKKIEEAAIEKIGSAKEMVETANSEVKKLDGAYQLTVIAGSLEDLEAVAKKAESTISKLKDGKNADLFKQAKLLYSAREAAREEDTAKAKKLYEKLIADYKGT